MVTSRPATQKGGQYTAHGDGRGQMGPERSEGLIRTQMGSSKQAGMDVDTAIYEVRGRRRLNGRAGQIGS